MVEGVQAWVLCGGQGRRMGGLDKGLLPWHGSPLALQTAQRLAPQVGPGRLGLVANRHLDDYRAWGWPVIRDDADLPTDSGPTVGLLTALRHSTLPWVMACPCDSPELPPDLVDTLHQAATAHRALIAVPITTDPVTGEARHHWTTLLAHRDTLSALQDTLHSGERRVRRWVQSCPWIGVSFADSTQFHNLNTPELLHGTPSA